MKRAATTVLVLCISYALVLAGAAAPQPPQLTFINGTIIVNQTAGNKYGFEGGTVVHDPAAAAALGYGPFYLFTSEVSAVAS